MKIFNVAMIGDADSWHNEDIKVPRFEHRVLGGDSWLRGKPSVFDTRHDDLLMFAATGRGFSRCATLKELTPDALLDNVPMGYTALTLSEKRAVVFAGSVARLWPGAKRAGGYTVQTVDAEGAPLQAGHTSILWHSVDLAMRWSATVPDRPFIVTAIYNSQNWH